MTENTNTGHARAASTPAKRIDRRFAAIAATLIAMANPASAACNFAETLTVPPKPGLEAGPKHAYRLGDGSAVFLGQFFIDADGAPKAYHRNDAKALDNLSNAGEPGNWWALATSAKDCAPSGKPVTQRPGDPAPGYYVAMTSMVNPAVNNCRKPANYVDSQVIPYVALSPKIRTFDYNRNLGALALVVNLGTKKSGFAVFADQAPNHGFGEGSIALGKTLGYNADPKDGGTGERQNLIIVFKDTMGFPKSAASVSSAAKSAFAKWGGDVRLDECLAGVLAAPR